MSSILARNVKRGLFLSLTVEGEDSLRGRKMNIKFVCVTLIAVLMLSACASGSYILTEEKRTPLTAAAIKLYTSPPQEYEVIAMVNASSDSGWT